MLHLHTNLVQAVFICVRCRLALENARARDQDEHAEELLQMETNHTADLERVRIKLCPIILKFPRSVPGSCMIGVMINISRTNRKKPFCFI